MNDQTNTIFGWVLAATGFALGGSILAGKYFDHSVTDAETSPGYVIIAEEEGAVEESGPSLAELLAVADPAAGENVFARCSTCHTVEQGGANGIGPNLYGVMGAAIAGKGGFGYSSALSGIGENWTWENMDAWLESPRGFADGTSMSFAGLGNPEDRANLLAYLNANGSNLPLPEVVAEEAAPEGEDALSEGEGAEAGVDEAAPAAAEAEVEAAATAE